MDDQTNKENFNAMAGTIYYTDIPKRLIKHGMSS